MSSATIQSLENDYRQLALSSRKSDGLVSQIFSSHSSSQNDVKESSEKVLLVLRGLKSKDPVDELKTSRAVVLKPLELAAETGSAQLIGQSLGIMQKLISCHALEKEDSKEVTNVLNSVEKVHDESVQLKILQTCLILLQSPIHPTNADSICSILSLCFRAMVPRGRKSQVMATAAATVRQAVAIVLSYVDVDAEVQRLQQPQSSRDESSSQDIQFDSKDPDIDESLEGLKASQRLLEDLIALSSGSPARWIKMPALQKTTSLEILDFALLSNPKLFVALPEFETSISLRIIQVLQSQLQDHLDVVASNANAASQNFASFKAVLKCIRTLMLLYHNLLGIRCRSLIQTLLKGMQSCQSLIHRVTMCQILRQLLGDPSLVLFLYVTFDARKESQADILISMVNMMTSAAESGLQGVGTSSDSTFSSTKMDAISQVYFSRDVAFDVEIDPSMPVSLQTTSYIVISMNAVLRCMGSVSSIVSHFLGQPIDGTEEALATSPKFHQPSLPLGEISRDTCESLVNHIWEPLLHSITSILKDCSNEKLEYELLESLQVFTEAIGKLHVRVAMTACLDSLCQIALSNLEKSDDIVEDTQVLRSKNIQSMKTVFKIARGLANDLGPAWHMVLEAMYSLDNILMDPKIIRMAAEKKESTLNDVDVNQNAITAEEIRDLREVMQDLFNSTRDMSSEGAVSLLGGLRDVSMHHLPQAEMVSQPKMSALNRMVDVLLANSFRVYDLWGSFLSHVLELVGDSKQSIRESAIDALGRAITGTLANLHASSTGDSTGGLEHMLLVALEALYNDDKEVDVRVGVLKVLSSVLQRNGERLTDGWTPVFRLLAAVAETASTETISLGCDSLQLVYSDYMDGMSHKKITRCLEVAELYGKQQADVNVSLTTISLFWNVGDMLGTKESSSTDNSEATLAFSAPTEELLSVIYNALYNISQDARPEVRNSGARTLFAMVSAHGNRLSMKIWEQCLWEKLFPLLRYSFHMSITSSKEEAEAALLGKSKGEQVRLVVHHSRNTEQKQWDETVVVCLAGMSRLIRSHVDTISRMKGFEDGWSELMVVVESSLAGGRKEVALSAMSLIGGLLSTNSPTITDAMWQRGIRAIDVGVVAATSGGCHVPIGARTELVNLIGSIYDENKDRFGLEGTIQVYKWIDSFCRNPWSEDDAANPVQPVGMPPVQKAALALLSKLQPNHDERLWPEFLQTVANLVEPEYALALLEVHTTPATTGEAPTLTRVGSANEALPPPSLAQYRFALNAAFVEKVMDHLVQLFEVAPVSARAASTAEIISVLGKCMELRYTAYEHSLWRRASTVFLKLAPLGVTAVDATVRSQRAGLQESDAPEDLSSNIQDDEVWLSLSKAFSRFLLGPPMPSSGQDKAVAVKSTMEEQATPNTVNTRKSIEKDGEVIPVIPFVPGTRKRRGGLFSSRQSIPKSEAQPAATEQKDPPPDTSVNQNDENQGKEDLELELQVLDCLTDEILTACGTASQHAIESLIEIVKEGISRPLKYQIPHTSKHSNFSLVCIRKMYVLCSRGTSPINGDNQDSLYEQVAQVRNHVAKCALPIFLKVCNDMICEFAEESQYNPLGDKQVERPKLEEIICILEVLATMTLSPDVVDSIMPPEDPVSEYIKLMRKRPDVIRRGKERTHLLFLYDSLCSLITCRDSRIRDMVRDVLGLAGADLGISLNCYIK